MRKKRKKREKKDRWSWIWDLIDLAELIYDIILLIPRILLRIIKEL